MKPFSFSTPQRTMARLALIGAFFTGSIAAFGADIWLYSGRDFTGATARISRSEPNLPIGAARSIRVGSGIWEACTGANFTGECRRLTAGDYRELSGRYGDTVLSARDVTYNAGSGSGGVGYAPPRIQLFEAPGFRGRTMTYEQSSPDLEGSWGLTTASSAIVSGGTWEVCTEYNYGGRCQALPPGQYNDLGPQLNFRIVSARALDVNRPPALPSYPPPVVVTPPPVQPPAWNGQRARIDVYTDTDFRGAAYTLDDGTGNLRNSGFNDRIRSMRIQNASWEVCEDRDFGGTCRVYGPGDYRRLPPDLDRAISSLRVVATQPNWGGNPQGGQAYVVMAPNAQRTGHPVWLYEHGNFGGRTVRATGDVEDLSGSGLNDEISAIFISAGTWQFCEDSDYRGRCITFGPGRYSEMPPGMNDSISSFRRLR